VAVLCLVVADSGDQRSVLEVACRVLEKSVPVVTLVATVDEVAYGKEEGGLGSLE